MKRRYPTLLAALLAITSLSALACGTENTAIPPSTPTSAFTLHGDGTATHNTTGLMWMRCSLEQTWDDPGCGIGITDYTWREALSAVVVFNAPGGFNGQAGFAGHTDWRLPNVKELESIIEQRCVFPAINGTVFPNSSTSFLWTSTPTKGDDGSAWAISFGDARVMRGTKNIAMGVRLVRDGN